MLAYALRFLGQPVYKMIEKEEFDEVHDLLAAILAKGLSLQLKRGLYREYITQNESLPVMRGKVDVNGTIQEKMRRKQLLACAFDVFSENNIFNQILKTTALILLNQPEVAKNRKTDLKRNILLLAGIDTVDPATIDWTSLVFHRSNNNYRVLLNICYFALKNLLLTTEAGNYKMGTFLKEHNYASLYEKFVLEYYRRHHPDLRPGTPNLHWATDDHVVDFLPVMKPDIVLEYGGKKLIIDTKYYSATMQYNHWYDTSTVHSEHLYQIYAYVRNADHLGSGNVAGLLLYAKTDEAMVPNFSYNLGGNRIMVKTLDLHTPFKQITKQLDLIADAYFSDPNLAQTALPI